ncbi:rod shape-determining protein MreC [Neobacillus notoginsengisoli]|uniref:Cell shape-determining protein MreC n=1 Tax=Neobacillus notoginsengisoli TaxID=1578198 RepID=A0A417YTY0_9BACI|nr:rod shape-determining protein MreC [Neobacillus notoginsengisoli]RHW40633.1 rod shape-determining protein MreC [Neobacillus notoginsengisoli]
MPQFFLNKRLIILLVSIIILVALIGFSLRERERLTWPEQFVKDSTGWLQSLVSRPVQYVAGFIENVDDLQDTYSENKELKSRVEDIVRLESEVYRLKRENTELRDILGKTESLSQSDLIHASVMGRNPDRWNELIIINKGTSDNVKKNMAVITSKGLVGKIKTANDFSSTVQLLSAMDPKNRISVVTQGDSEVFGFVEGFDDEKKLLKVKKIPYEAKVKKGQIVITSGLGGVFPEGLLVGKIVEVEPDQYGLNQIALVKPEADFYGIREVMVVKRLMMKPDRNDMVDDKEEEL